MVSAEPPCFAIHHLFETPLIEEVLFRLSDPFLISALGVVLLISPGVMPEHNLGAHSERPVSPSLMTKKEVRVLPSNLVFWVPAVIS